MAHTFSIKRSDRSGTWYLTPGTKSIYDLQISNDSKSASDCTLMLEQPASGVSVEPQTLSLRSHEVRTVTVIFAADALPEASRRVLMTVRDGSDIVQATFEQPVSLTSEAEAVPARSAAFDLPLFSGQAAPLLTSGGGDAAPNGVVSNGSATADASGQTTQLALTFPLATPASDAQSSATTPSAVAPTYRSVYSPRPLRGRGRRRADMLMVALAIVCIVLAAILFKPVSLRALPSLTRATAGRALAPLEPHAVARSARPAAAIHPRTRSAPTLTTPSAPTPVVSSPAQASPTQIFFKNVGPERTHRAVSEKIQSQTVAHSKAKKNQKLSSDLLTAPAPADPTALSAEQRLSVALAQRQATQHKIAAVAAPVVSVQSLNARYSALGRAVRIDWSAGGQSSAKIALVDPRGAALSSLTVTGAQQSARLPLPMQYRSSVVVQLTSTGRLGERVVQTLTLPPYSR